MKNPPNSRGGADAAIAAARKARVSLLRRAGVAGVGHGWKISRGRRTGEYALVVYVRKKRPLAQLARAERIPKWIGGVRTDVVETGKARSRLADEREHRFVDYMKAHREWLQKQGAVRAQPSTANDRDIGNIAVIEDDPRQSFIIASRRDVDWVGAYKKFRLTHGDEYDFVTFWSDFPVNCQCGAFYCGLTNPARGINWSACMPQGRAGWGSNRLQAFMYFIRDDDAALLQEIGHHWGAFTGFKLKASDRRTSYENCLDNQPGHWSSYLDDDASPMDYDESELRLGGGQSVDWIDNGDGTFSRRIIGQGQYRFSKLDLYLMGVIAPEEVGSFFLIRNPRSAGGKTRGEKVTLGAENIIIANGKRIPAAAQSPRSFTNTFILLTRDAGRVQALVKKLERTRARFSAVFSEATGNRARVITELAGRRPDFLIE